MYVCVQFKVQLKFSSIINLSDKNFFDVCIAKEIEKFIIRQPPTGEKDDYDSKTHGKSRDFSIARIHLFQCEASPPRGSLGAGGPLASHI